MKPLTEFKSLLLIMAAIIITCCCGCGNDEPAYNDIVGSWYGTRTYYNPVSGTKYQYLTITFEANGTGSLEYEAPTSYSVAKFTYSVKNKNITCKGAYATTSGGGDFDLDFNLTLKIEGDRLLPVGQYNSFILTKDNSVITDGDGNVMSRIK